LNRAVRAPPIWRKPVGEGAKRVTTGAVIDVNRRVRNRPRRAAGVYQEPHITKAFLRAGLGLVARF
jgi:hypothetical protein